MGNFTGAKLFALTTTFPGWLTLCTLFLQSQVLLLAFAIQPNDIFPSLIHH